jgi:hypothetical protein
LGRNSTITRSRRISDRAGWALDQATDTKLGRSVAIKILPETFARDAERVTRTGKTFPPASIPGFVMCCIAVWKKTSGNADATWATYGSTCLPWQGEYLAKRKRDSAQHLINVCANL